MDTAEPRIAPPKQATRWSVILGLTAMVVALSALSGVAEAKPAAEYCTPQEEASYGTNFSTCRTPDDIQGLKVRGTRDKGVASWRQACCTAAQRYNVYVNGHYRTTVRPYESHAGRYRLQPRDGTRGVIYIVPVVVSREGRTFFGAKSRRVGYRLKSSPWVDKWISWTI